MIIHDTVVLQTIFPKRKIIPKKCLPYGWGVRREMGPMKRVLSTGERMMLEHYKLETNLWIIYLLLVCLFVLFVFYLLGGTWVTPGSSLKKITHGRVQGIIWVSGIKRRPAACKANHPTTVSLAPPWKICNFVIQLKRQNRKKPSDLHGADTSLITFSTSIPTMHRTMRSPEQCKALAKNKKIKSCSLLQSRKSNQGSKQIRA